MPKIAFNSADLPSGLSPRERLGLWRDLYVERFGRIDMSQPETDGFGMRSEFMQIGAICVSRAAGTVSRFERPKADMPDLFTISLPTTPGRVETSNLDLVYRPGDLFGFDTRTAMRVRGSGCGWIGLAIPRSMLAHLPGGADALHGRPVSINTPAGRHLSRYLQFLLGSDDVGDAQTQSRIADHVVELAALALQGGAIAPGDARRGIRAARTLDILAIIDRGFADPGFSVERVAAETGLSPRYIQELLQESGTSLTARLNELRLQRAFAMLADRRFDGLRISEIALSCGFSEVSYFNRLFRRRFEAAPGDLRRS